MINAKDKFREGFIMLQRPFDFADLKNPLQKFTILWAYSERPIIKNVLTKEGREKLELIENSSNPISFWNKEEKEKRLEREIEYVMNNPKYHEPLYEGEIVQVYVEGKLCRIYPDEYTIISKERLNEIMVEEGYHVVCDNALYLLKDFTDKKHYLQSRGVSERVAKKWASLSYGSLVMYKPYYELLKMFCRPYEIIADDNFYEEVEGVDFTELKEVQKEFQEMKREKFVERFL
jgi:hypothetical protein